MGVTDRLDRHQPLVLGLFRIVIGLLFTSEGAATLFGVLDRDATPAGDWPFWYAGVIELVCGALILLGVLTRAAAFLSSGAMAFAYFTEHQPDGLFPSRTAACPRRCSAGVSCCWCSSAPEPWPCRTSSGETPRPRPEYAADRTESSESRPRRSPRGGFRVAGGAFRIDRQANTCL